MAVKRTMYQRKVGVDMLNAAKSVLADVSRVSPSSEQRRKFAIDLRSTCASFGLTLVRRRTFIAT